MRHIFKYTALWLLLLLPAWHLHAQHPTAPRRDTTYRSTLPTNNDSIFSQRLLEELEIYEQQAPSTTRAQAPTQVIDAQEIEQRGTAQLSDAVQQMVGLILKDYGGVGGMKTVSARGLGSQFSTLSIDGIAVSDAQNGQVDLGRYMLGNTAYINFTNGQQQDLLQTARVYAAGNVINMETQEPSFLPSEYHRIKVGMEGGSFGYISPSILWEQKVNKKLYFTLWGNHMQSRGDYPFHLYYTPERSKEHSTIERRTNSQMHMTTADANLFYRTGSSRLSAKLHLINGYHALPGPVRLYTVGVGSQHSEERLFFGQVKWRYDIAPAWQLQLLGKEQHSLDIYEDTADVASITGRLRNEYRQNEGYLSAALQYQPFTRLKVGFSTDEAINTLESNLATNNHVQRLSTLNVLSAAYTGQHFDANANLLSTLMYEQAKTTATDLPERNSTYQKFSPYVGCSWQPFAGSGTPIRLLQPLRLRYFFKQTYRVPTFGEAFYNTSNSDLKPEEALQHNVGLSFTTSKGPDSTHLHPLLPEGTYLALTVDGYKNHVKNKIVAMPTQNMYIWSMVNYGLAHITGLDAKVEVHLPYRAAQVTVSLTYSYQQALDKTDSTSKTYNNQILYTPLHSGGANLWVSTRYVDVGYDATWVGARYSMAQNSPSNRVQGYVDQGLTLSHKFLLRHGTLLVRARVLNIFNVQYEVVHSYPMMGRNFRIALIYNI